MTTITPSPDVQPLTVNTVLAAALGNILAGTGLGMMVGVVLALIGIDPLKVLLWSLAAAAFWSGFIMWVWFSRDEARNWRRYASMELEIEDLEELVAERDAEIEFLNGQLNNAQRPLIISERGKSYTIPRQPRDVSWQNAMALIRATADYGVIPGRGQSNLDQDAQSAALHILIDAKLVARKGTIYRLLTSAQHAVDTLSAHGDPDESRTVIQSGQEVASGFGSSPIGAEEGR